MFLKLLLLRQLNFGDIPNDFPMKRSLTIIIDFKNYLLTWRMLKSLFCKRVLSGIFSLHWDRSLNLFKITIDWVLLPQDWPTLLVLCRDFYNSVNPKGPSKCGRESDSDNRMSEADRNAHHKKIKTWFLNPSRYKSELEAEQKKHHGKCIYHLSRSHTTENCHVKKECDATVAGRGSSNNSSSNSASTTGQLRHITEESFEDAIDDQVVDSSEDVPNNTNEDNLHYFS